MEIETRLKIIYFLLQWPKADSFFDNLNCWEWSFLFLFVYLNFFSISIFPFTITGRHANIGLALKPDLDSSVWSYIITFTKCMANRFGINIGQTVYSNVYHMFIYKKKKKNQQHLLDVYHIYTNVCQMWR